MTFDEAIAMGEYKPELLSQYPEIVEMVEASAIPEMKQKMVDNIFKQIRELEKERERLYYEYLGGED